MDWHTGGQTNSIYNFYTTLLENVKKWWNKDYNTEPTYKYWDNDIAAFVSFLELSILAINS